MMKRYIFFFVLFPLFIPGRIYANTISGQDCQGQNLICDGSTIGCGGVVCQGSSPGNTFLTGIFTNVGLFQIPISNMIYIVGNQSFAVYAATIDVEGVIDASGAGGPGGSGGSGNPPTGGVSGSGPSPGTAGPYSGSGGSVNAGGGGGYGGSGGNGSVHPGSSSSPGQGGSFFGSADLDSIPLSTASVTMGSGGGGGTGQQLSLCAGPHDGGVGGAGGGSVYLEADSMTVSGAILANASGGGDGINSTTCTWSNSSGAAGGGGGSGGGILLRGLNVLYLGNDGEPILGLQANGGNGGGADGLSAYSGGGGSGGRVKLFYGSSLTSSISISTSAGAAGLVSFGDINSSTGIAGSSGTIFSGAIPLPPTNLSILSVGDNSGSKFIQFQWNASASFGSASTNSDLYKYYNFVSTYAQPATTQFIASISTLGAGPYTYQDNNLTPNTFYQRFVTAYSDYGNSFPSAVVSTWTWAAVPITNGYTMSGNTDTIVGQWSSNGNPAGTNYYAEISTVSSMNPIYLTNTTSGGQAVFYSTLPANTTYYFQVQAVNGAGIPTAFSTNSFITDADEPFNTQFNSVFQSSITFAWSTGNSAGTSYLAEISEDGFQTILASATTTSLSLRFSPLHHNTTYYFRVAAVNYDNIQTTFSPIISTITLPGNPASPVYSNVDNAGFTFQWTPANPPGTNFYVEIATDSAISSTGSFVSVIDSTVTTNNNQSFPTGAVVALTSLSPNTTYYSHVQAIGWGGDESVFSTLSDTITLANAPAIPSAGDPFSLVYFTSFTFSWNANGNPMGTNYIAEISTNGFINIASSLTTTASNAAFTNLIPDTLYQAQVAAVSYDGIQSVFTPAVSTTTLSETPLLLSFSNIQAQALSVNWHSGGNGSGASYEIDLSTNSNFATLFSSAQTSALSWSFSSLLVNTTFYSQVKAMPDGGYSPSVSTVTLTVAPSVPSVSSVGLSSFTWSWSGLGNPQGTLYLCELSTNSFLTLVQSSQTYNLQAGFVGLSTNTIYQSQVEAISFGGTPGPFSSPLVSSATLAAVPADIQPPFSGLGSDQMTYTWGDGTNPGGTTYAPEISTAPDFSVFTASDATLALSDTFGGLLPNTTYYGRVQAINYENILSAFSSTQSVVTFALAPSSASPVFSAISSAALSVNWTSGGNPSGTQYEAQISNNGFQNVIASDTLNFSAVFTGLLPNTTYQFRAAAFNYAGQEGSFSSLFTTSTLAALPVAAIPAEDVVSSVSISAQWNSGGNPITTLYAADISTSTGLSPILATEETNSALSLSFNGLFPNTTYYFQVRAINNNGIASSTAALGSAMTYAALPNVSASTSTGQISISTFSFTSLVSTGPGGIGFYREAFNTEEPYFFSDSESTWTGLSPLATSANCNGNWYLHLKSYNASSLGDATADFGEFIVSTNTPSAPGQPKSNTGTSYAATTLGWNWSPSSECGSSSNISYLISVGTTSSSFKIISSSNVGSAQNFILPSSMTVSGQTYYAVIQASDSAGALGPFSLISSPVTDDQSAPVPGIPQAPSYNYTSTATFTWTAATNSISGISGYVFQLGTTQGGSDIFNQSVGNVLSYTYSFLSNGVYYARVAAITGAGLTGSFSASSQPISVWVTSQSTPIPQPYNWPNPFDPHKAPTNIGFYAASPATITIKIYTLEENLVYRTSFPVGAAGNVIWPWSGHNGSGRMIEPGGYIAVIEKDYASSKEIQRFKIAVLY